MRPSEEEYFPYFHKYIELVPEYDPVSALQNTSAVSLSFMETIPENKWDYAYAEGKWNLKELFMHVIDTERIFAYRALAFARGEKQLLPSFDEDQYAANSNASKRKPIEIIQEYESTRQSTIALYRSFSQSFLALRGRVPAGTVSVNALGFAICGHNLHHLKVATERYLK